mgnify:CR=1 FL=1
MLAYHLGDMDLSIQKSKRYVPQNDHVHISHSEARKFRVCWFVTILVAVRIYTTQTYS